jgi:natural product precursor
MKKVKLNKKLQLNKETIANLNEKEMNQIYGGLQNTISNCNRNSCKGIECMSNNFCTIQNCISPR